MPDAAARIPQELFDDIIDSISSKHDLSSCSLVSRSWLARSRRNLFARVKLTDEGVHNQFHSFLAFLPLENNDSLLGPPVSAYVKRICVENCAPLPGARERIDTDRLRALLSLLPNLRDLELSHIILHWVPPAISDAKRWPTFRPTHLDSLTLLGTTTVSQTSLEVVASLCLFSSIKVLYIETFVDIEGFEGRYSHPQDSTAQSTHPLLSVEKPYFPSKLRVSSIKIPYCCHTPFFLGLIAETASVDTITDIDVACRSSDQIRALGSFLGVVGQRIKKITVDIIVLSYRNTLNSDLGRAFNLSACTTLTDLTLRMILSPHLNDTNTAAFTAAATLLSVISTTLETVILEIQLGGITLFWSDQDDSDYLRRVRESAASEFTHVQSVIKQREGVRKLCIRWGHMPHEKLGTRLIEEMDLFARQQLSELDANGILCFESV